MSDQFIRKPVVFNKESAWHMEILNRIAEESNNFSGYVMSILKCHFEKNRGIQDKAIEQKKSELPVKGVRIVVNDKKIDPKL